MHIVIVGAGATGTEIAQALASRSEQITLHDTDARVLRLSLAQISRSIDADAKTQRITPWAARRAKRVFHLTTRAQQCCADADMVIEAIHDDLSLKQALLRDLDALVAPATILATSTEMHSVTALASVTRRPDRVIGLHFCKPAHMTGIVEIVRTPTTDQQVLDRAVTLVRRLDKTPILVPDTPGLIVNRIAQAFYGEALSLLDNGGVDAATIDKLMEAAGFARGPFREMDYRGVDRVLAVAQAMYEATFHASHYRPHSRLDRMHQAGLNGEQSPRGGFYPKEPAAT